MNELILGGYNLEFRVKVLTSAMKGYMKMYNDQKEGTGRINRPERTTRLRRRWGKLVGKTTWYKNRKGEEGTGKSQNGFRKKNEQQLRQEVEGTFYVPYTKGSALKKLMQTVED